MPARSQTCPACQAGESEAYATKDAVAIYRCRNCHSLYATCASLSYDGYYDAANLSVPEFVQRRYDKILGRLKSYRRTNRLLDIGCGAGALLEAARRAGWNAYGVDLSKTSAAHVSSLGFEVFCGDVTASPYPADHFDVVTAIELFEHVDDLLGLLTEVRRILRPGGVLWGTTPNARGFSARLLGTDWSIVCPPEHLQLLSVRGLTQVIARAGFDRVATRSRGGNPFEIWHAVRKRVVTSQVDGDEPVSFNRVQSSYALNQALLRNPVTRSVKHAVNAALALTGLGDTIQIRAIKAES